MHVAFALAAVLDELGRQLRNLDDEVRGATLDRCRALLRESGGRAARPARDDSASPARDTVGYHGG